MKNRKTTELLKITRLNKFSLNENACDKVYTVLKQKLQFKKSAFVYQFVNLFNLSSLRNLTFSFIQRCFTIVSIDESFLELEYKFISKILASSELLITSEIEVFKVANRWLSYNIKERSKYAEDLVLKVRLHLLSTETVRHLLNDFSLSKKDDGCIKFLNKILDYGVNCFYKSSSISYKSRYCNQKYFKLMVCGGAFSGTSIARSNVSCIDVNKVGNVKLYYPPMKTERFSAKIVYLKGDIYVFGGYINLDWIKSIEKYSFLSKTWSQVAEMCDDREYFSACAFMDKIFVTGGYSNGVTTSSCLQFYTSNYSWKEVATLKEARSSAACAVFDERIVVCGGSNKNLLSLNTVESYDVLPDRWSNMPNMNSGKSCHSLVVVKNKLFVISRIEDDCEVFDNICKRFITIKSPGFDFLSSIRANAIENKIFVFKNKFTKIFFYDTDKNEWSKEFLELNKNLQSFSCVKVPCL